jgi:hypothetical protein
MLRLGVVISRRQTWSELRRCGIVWATDLIVQPYLYLDSEIRRLLAAAG